MVTLLFRTLERIAPGVGAWLMTRIWSTPTGAKSARAQDHRPSTGVVAKLALPDGRAAVVEVWGPQDAPSVYLLHGWGGWRGQLGALVNPLVANGFRVVAVDAMSHGDSDRGRWGRRQALIPDFVDALDVAVASHGPAHAVITHSFGGTALTFAVAEGFSAQRVVLISPMAGDFDTLSRHLGQRLGYGERIRVGLLRRVERRLARPLTDFDLISRLRALGDRAPAAMVVHDRDDRTVPHSDSARISGAWSNSELVATNGLGHHRILRDPTVIELAVGFVAERSAVPAPLP